MTKLTSFFKKLSVPQVIVIAYVFFITIGTILLALPFASASGEWTPLIPSSPPPPRSA